MLRRRGAATRAPGRSGARHCERAVNERADAKVGNFGLAAQVDQDVGGLYVAVHLRGQQRRKRSPPGVARQRGTRVACQARSPWK